MRTGILQTEDTFRSAGGFTFIELTVVIVLVGLFVALVAQSLSPSFRETVDSEITAILSRARRSAIVSNSVYHVRFFEGTCCEIYEDDELIATRELGDQVVTKSGFIFFHPDGTSSGGEINICGSKGLICTIYVDMATGRATTKKVDKVDE